MSAIDDLVKAAREVVAESRCSGTGEGGDCCAQDVSALRDALAALDAERDPAGAVCSACGVARGALTEYDGDPAIVVRRGGGYGAVDRCGFWTTRGEYQQTTSGPRRQP